MVGCADARRPARRDDTLPEVCASTAGRCWYVAPDGDDSGDGSFAAPLRTPQLAIRQARPGDVVYLRGGVYDASHAHPYEAVQWDDPTQGTRDAWISLGRVAVPSWAGGSHDVHSGTADAPIVVRSYPGERACSDGAGRIRIGPLSTGDNAFWIVESLTLRGAPITIGGGTSNAQVHDIILRRNEVYAFESRGGSNPGLVRVGRGDVGGPSDILIEWNILHDLIPVDPDGVTRDWKTTQDAQHFGAVTTLSCETYLGASCLGNGQLTVRSNEIYHTPQAFFFKNPTLGPVFLQENVIRDVGSLGQWSPSNITFERNLVLGPMGGARLGGTGGSIEEPIYDRIGRNLVMQDNTFVGMRTVVEFRIYASGHTFRRNIVQGLDLPVSQGTWNEMGMIFQARSWVYPDDVPDLGASQLAQGNLFEDNCYVTPIPDFLAYGRRHSAAGSTVLTHLTLDEARSQLGFDRTSDRVADVAAAFADFANLDLQPKGPCSGRGAPLPAWFTP